MRVARHHRYLVFFTHNAERIEVLRILHAARALQSLLNRAGKRACTKVSPRFITAIASRLRLSLTQCGCISGFRRVFVWSRQAGI
ncbi:hypothetical protein [Ochrobactrum quorumnocens]|uniref:hypothetical protein n=1 Tax=Ochrobactrum quorumnocens TaxID=271865 RepID=UPI003312FF86